MSDLDWIEHLAITYPDARDQLRTIAVQAATDRHLAADLGVLGAEAELDPDLMAFLRACFDLQRRALAGEVALEQLQDEANKLSRVLAETSLVATAEGADLTPMVNLVLGVVEHVGHLIADRSGVRLLVDVEGV